MSSKLILFAVAILAICLPIQNVSAEIDIEGPNVCFKEVKTNVTTQTKFSYPIEVSTFSFCPRFPFRCKSKKTEYRIGIKPEVRTVTKRVAQCCEGYIEEHEKCKPFCPKSCVHGVCSAPGVCDCQPGSGGISCNMTCPALKFGLACEYDCACLVNPHCSSTYKTCTCEPGNFEKDCENICKCRFSVCNPGFIGKNCDTECPAGTFGSNCIGKCLCWTNNTLECSKINGDCRCKEGYYGIFCENHCPGNLTCSKTDGYDCHCEKAVTDIIADNSLSLKRESEKFTDQTSNHSLIFSLIGLLVVTIFLSMLLFYKYKVKTRKLKRDLESYSIRYHNGGNSNDQFVNPMYSYTTGSSVAASSYLGSNLPSTYNGSSYAPSSITMSTLPHPPRNNQLNGLNAHSSLTTPRKPQQNGYLNNLSLLPNYLIEKNRLADAANPTLMSRDDTINSNIYTTIEEARDLKSANQNDFEDNYKPGDLLRKEFSSNFNDFREDPAVFKIPEDNESVDYAFNKVIRKNEMIRKSEMKVSDDELSPDDHYDKPRPKLSTFASTYDTPRPIKDLKSESNPVSQTANHSNEETETSHYDFLNANYPTLKKDSR